MGLAGALKCVPLIRLNYFSQNSLFSMFHSRMYHKRHGHWRSEESKAAGFWVLCFHNALRRYLPSSHKLFLICGFTSPMWGSSLVCNYPTFPEFVFSSSHFRARSVFSSVMKGISFSSYRTPICNYWKHQELIILRDSISWIPAFSSFPHFISILLSWDIAWWKLLSQGHNWVKSNPCNKCILFVLPPWLNPTWYAICHWVKL